MGKIGSGKTTLVNSLLRLYNVNKDSIYIDGNDIMSCDISSLRKQIAYVPQDNFLFSDKIKNNIAFSNRELDFSKIKMQLDLLMLMIIFKTLQMAMILFLVKEV